MTRLPAILSSAAALGTLAMIALSAMLWWIGPLIAVDPFRPLESRLARGCVIALLWCAWLGRLSYVAWRKHRANAALMDGIASPSLADQEAQVLGERFREAVARLKAFGGAGRWFARSRTLYDLPWYVIVGAPGAGATTTLRNSGLPFLMGDDDAALEGVGAMRHCQWWLTSDAVLIDIGGRYALAQPDSKAHAAGWDAFLSLLRKVRPRRPINGVLLMVSMQDLLSGTGAQRAELAMRLRARLHELQSKLGVNAPVYVMVTKVDLLAGFEETFAALSREERDQVWGFTFDAALGTALDGGLSSRALHAPYKALVDRLNASLVESLQGEREVARRASILAFVHELWAIEPLLGGFLVKTFESIGRLQEPIRLRGVYLCSGAQPGNTVERGLLKATHALGLDSVSSGEPAAVGRTEGKGYFIRRLLVDLVFREQHLVAFNAVTERRRVVLRSAGFASIALLCAGCLAAWTISYLNNKGYVAQVSGRVPVVRAAVAALPPSTDAGLVALSATLDAVRTAARGDTFAVDEPPLPYRGWLYQGQKLDAGAKAGYRRILSHALLPRLEQRIEDRLRAVDRRDLEQSYEALKAYLMLYTPEGFDADSLRAWITSDWDVQWPGLASEQRAAMEAHLQNLLDLGAPRASRPMDKALVDDMRQVLSSYPLEYRIYGRLKRRYGPTLPEFTVVAAAGPGATGIFERRSGLPLSRGVPGLYTRAGYAKAFQGSLVELVVRLTGEEQWVLGQRTTSTSTASLTLGKELPNRVRVLYLNDYAKAWDEVLADVGLVRVANLAQGIEMARKLAAIDSPLASWLNAVIRETTLVQAPLSLTTSVQSVGTLVDKARNARDDIASLVEPKAAGPGSNGPIERIVDDHFLELHQLARGQPPAMNLVLQQFADAAVSLTAIDSARAGKQPLPVGGIEKIRDAAATQVEPVRQMLASMGDAAAEQGRVAERDSMTGDLKPLRDFCQRAIGDRYPFSSASQADVLPEDFAQLFGTGGLLDEFFQKRLAALVDTSSGTWTYKASSEGSKASTPAALIDFQRAARIREVFFRNKARAPALRFDVRALSFSPGLRELILDADGTESRLTQGSTITLAWPSSRVASQVRLYAVPAGEPLLFEGPWALFRMFDRFEVQSARPEKFVVTLLIDDKRAELEVTANSVFNPFRMRELQQFRCPGPL